MTIRLIPSRGTVRSGRVDGGCGTRRRIQSLPGISEIIARRDRDRIRAARSAGHVSSIER